MSFLLVIVLSENKMIYYLICLFFTDQISGFFIVVIFDAMLKLRSGRRNVHKNLNSAEAYLYFRYLDLVFAEQDRSQV